MKKIRERILRLFITLDALATSLFGYGKIDVISHVEPVEIPQVQASVSDQAEEIVLPEEEEINVIPESETHQVHIDYSERVIQPEVQGDSIKISNVLNSHLMKDYTGEYFYLDHNMDGVYDGRGVPFIDFRTDFTTRKTLIYAHSSPSGNGPFQALQNYHNNPSFYQNNRYINIHYQDRDYQYEIFSVYVSLADNDMSEGLEYFREIEYTDSQWANTIQKYKNNSEYETGVSVNQNDKILILQTCSMDPNYYEKYYRYNLVVMAKLIS